RVHHERGRNAIQDERDPARKYELQPKELICTSRARGRRFHYDVGVLKNDLFLRACRREPTETTPVWFMRQAGRYMPEYRKLREKHTLLDLCKTPALACEVTMQPLRLGVDAAILFADILLPLEPMGAPFEFAKGEGPVIHEPISSRGQIDKLRVIDPQEGLGY